MRYIWLILAVVIITSSKVVLGQSLDDSIIKKIDSLNNNSRDNFRINFEVSAKSAQDALEMSFQYNYQKGLAYAYRNFAILSYFGENLSFALDYIFKAMDIFETIADHAGIADCNITLGTIFYRLGEHESSLKYHQMAYDFFKNSNKKDRLAIASYNLAESYFLNGKLDKAEEYLIESISVNETVGNLPLLSSSFMYLGRIEYVRFNYVSSIEMLNESLTINAKLDVNNSNKEVLVESHYWLGMNRKALNQRDLAKYHLNKSLELSDEFKIKNNIEENLFELAELALISNDIQGALQIFNRFKDSRNQDERLKNENAKNLIKDIVQLRDIEKEALNLKSENQINEDRIAWLTYSAILLTLIGVLLFTLLFNYFRLFRKSKELQQLKSQFIAMAVHEFKNPIGIISSALELMKIYQEQIDNPVVKPKIELQLNKITRQEKRLNSLVEDLMIFEELFMNKYTIYAQKFELLSFIKEIADDLRDSDNEKREVILESSLATIPIWYDKVLLHHLISNVLGNAYKYSLGNPAPICSIQMGATTFIIVIKDFGIGIPLAEQRSIFKEFFRASNVGDKKGSGIGLAIVKSIVDRLNGKIDFNSDVNIGTTVTLILPYLSTK